MQQKKQLIHHKIMKKLTTLAIIIAISTFCVAQKSITEITD